MKKLTRGQSCVLCQQRKMRCDQQKPCTNCVRAQKECVVVPLPPPKPRRSKQQQLLQQLHQQQQPANRALVDRLHRYEALLAQHGVSVEDEPAVARSPKTALDTASAGQDASKRVKWFAYYKEYEATDELLRDSSDDESDQPAIYHDFDATFADADGFPFIGDRSAKNIGSLHPPTIEMLQLWQIYIQRVDPLLKISHVPTLQAQIVGAGANPGAVPKPLEALLFAIYLIAVHAMADHEVQDTFHESKPRLLARYSHATQQALINAAFLRAPELMVLQAYLLYLFSLSRSVDPRSLFCLVGIAMRIATRLGLHRDCARFGMSPFETELRRRLWWQTVIFDRRLAEMTGSPVAGLTSTANDCCLPLNVNDPDLHPSAKDPPTPAVGASEMLFSLTRIELTMAVTTSTALGSGGKKRSREASSTPSFLPALPSLPSPSASSPAATEADKRVAPKDIDAYCAYFEAVYLQHCDPTIPVQHFTLLMGRAALCKLRILSFMRRGVPSSTLAPAERDAIFLAAIQMVEYDTLVCTTDSLRGFRWYADLHVPMLGSILLASEMRLHPTGELCDRAWKALCDNQEQRSVGRGGSAEKRRGGPMQATFERLLLKAWEACEQADLQSGFTTQRQVPSLIVKIRGSKTVDSNSSSKPCNGDSDNHNNSNHNTEPLPTASDAPVTTQLTPMSLPLFDGTDQGLTATVPDYNPLDWMYLAQSEALGGFMDGDTGMYFG